MQPHKMFVTYGCDRFEKSKTRLEREVTATGCFDSFKAYTPEFVKPLLRTKNARRALDILQNEKKGGGFYIWKPFVIQHALEKARAGDIIVYADAGCTLLNRPERIQFDFEEILRDEMGVRHTGTGGPRVMFNRMDVVVALVSNVKEYFVKNFFWRFENEANRLIFRKCEASVRFVDKWVDVAIQNPEWFTDQDSTIPNHWLFREHRHDQSIYNGLAHEHGVRASRLCTWLRASRRRE